MLHDSFSTRRRIIGAVTSVFLGGALLGAEAVAETAPPVQPPQAAPSQQAPFSFADLVERVKPAVVNVSTTQKVERREGPSIPGLPPGFPEEFFKRFFGEQPPGAEPEEQTPPPGEAHALGSGFVIDPSGWVVTNNHVIGEAEEISVTLQDGSQLEATIKGRDDKTDIALLKVEPKKPLPFVSFGDSEKTRVGDWVVAVGNPFGLGGTVTAGIVSAHGRNINAGPYDDFMQIDAAINRGNSGGPTFNLAGEVVGVNTAIYSPSGGSIGIGFAIPSNMVKMVVSELREKGRVDRGWLGVQIQDVTPEIASALDLPTEKGALIADVLPDGPAKAAGFQQGDIIVSFAEQPIEEAHTLPRVVAALPAGKSVPVTVLRQGNRQTLEVTIGKMPDEPQVAAAEPPAEKKGELGMVLSRLTPDLRGQLKVAEGVDGVVVHEVEPGSEAARKGIRSGDVILSINQKAVAGPAEVTSALEQAKKDNRKSVVVLVNRDGSQRFVALELPA